MRTLVTAIVLVLVAAGPAAGAVFVHTGASDIGDPNNTTGHGNDPGIPGGFLNPAPGVYSVMGGGGDWWDWGERAFVVYDQWDPVAEGTKEWRIEAEAAWVPDPGNEWAKAGVFARNEVTYDPPGPSTGLERQVNAFTAITRPDKGRGALQWRPDDTNNWMGNITVVAAQPTKVALQRREFLPATGVYVMEGWVDRGTGWEYLGSTSLDNLRDDCYYGLAVCGHNNAVTETCDFNNVQVVAPVAPPPPVATTVNDPEGVGPVMGGWGCLEVVDNGDLSYGNPQTFIDSLESGTGVRVAYDCMGPQNYNDHEGNQWSFPNDRGYQVVYDGHKAAGAVDDLAFLARAQVVIPANGVWSFYCAGDDYTELAVSQGGVTKMVIGDNVWNSRSYGACELAAGVADIQFIFGEEGGGCWHEVAAAPGLTSNIDDFTLIGDPGSPDQVSIIPTLTGQGECVTITQSQPGCYVNPSDPPDTEVNNLAEALTSLATCPTLSIQDIVVNHCDPDNGDGTTNWNRGTWGNDHAYPYDGAAVPGPTNGVDDNDFGIRAVGLLHIAQDDTYLIGYNGDDGCSLQIFNQPWLSIVETNHPVEAMIAGDIMSTDVPTGNAWTVGEIFLAAGDYEFELVNFERGGGAHVEMFGGTVQGYYALIDCDPSTPDSIFIPGSDPGLRLVPEPTTWAMLLGVAVMGLVALWRRRK